MDLTSIEEIRQLKFRYFRCLDLKLWEEFGECLTDDITARFGTKAMSEPVHHDSRAEVVAFMSEHLGPEVITVHVASHPEITVDGDSATGSWLFEDTVIATAFDVLIRGGGYYTDRYRRDADGSWRIAGTQYDRIYESMTSLADLPSFQLIANMWDPELGGRAARG